MSQAIRNIPVEQIRAGNNDRRTFAKRPLQELADSIRENGLAQPITVRPVFVCKGCEQVIANLGAAPEQCPTCANTEFSSAYEIVAGERRFRACSELLQWDTIPAIIRELNNEQAAGIMLAENLNREDLNPIDEGHAYKKRIDEFGWTVAEIARRANVSEGRVKNRLSLLKLRPEAQKLVADGYLALGFGEDMSKLDNNRQLIALRWLQQQKAIPTRRTFSAMVNELYQQQCQETMFDLDDFFSPGMMQIIEQSKTGRLSDILPRKKDLPELPERQGSIGRVLDEYCAVLINSNMRDAAEIVLDLWAKLIAANYCNISPFDSKALTALQTASRGGLT